MVQKYKGRTTCAVVYCKSCGKVVDKSIRGQGRTCSDYCHELNQKAVRKEVDSRKIQRNPNLYKEVNQRHKAKVDADPELRQAYLEKEKRRYKKRRNDESYKATLRKAKVKYQSKHKDRIDAYRKKYREVIGDEAYFDQRNIAESNRSLKRSEQLLELKANDPVAYEKYKAERREYFRKYRADKRLMQMQKDLSELVNKDE